MARSESKLAEQQQSEIAPRRQTRPPDAVGIELRALCLDEGVEARVVEDAIQLRKCPALFGRCAFTLPLLTHA